MVRPFASRCRKLKNSPTCSFCGNWTARCAIGARNTEEDNSMFIPFETGRKLSPQSTTMMLQMRARSGTLGAALNQVEAVLRHQRGLKYNQNDDFDLQTANRIIEQFDSITMLVGLFAI